MQREEALEALVAAQDITSRVRSRGRWYAVYASGFAGVAFSFPLALGLAPAPATVAVGMPLVLAAILGLSVYAYRQPMAPYRYGRLHVGMIACWGVLHSITMVVGMTAFKDVLWWWAAMALLCAVPPLTAAVYARAHSEEPRA
ncbi:hypothetical protein [Streptomonospora litoralis]|uniref:Uncharacterized protein n=1 Tax=Streptomonospora litoralis TaxID=2498135 RepID=A0A4P6Q746_9ACTN|nr:hypothetical protein [Streptomonospora litoralis]QBI56565.1 hypothetical protein EKD16_24100 [Streptomonospora litoralis]